MKIYIDTKNPNLSGAEWEGRAAVDDFERAEIIFYNLRVEIIKKERIINEIKQVNKPIPINL